MTLQTVGAVAWMQADLSTPTGHPLVISEADAQSAMASVRSQLATSLYRPLWAKFTEAEKIVLYSLAQQQKTAQRDGYQEPPRAADPRRWSWQPQIHALEKALWGVHEEARSIITALSDRGIIHHVERDGMLGFAAPGFSDFVIAHAAPDLGG
jgi:hypothetical protein